MSTLEKIQPGRRIRPDFTPVLGPQELKQTQRISPLRFGCGFLFVFFLVYFLAPLRTNFLILGVDDSLGRGSLGRTDTIILTTVVPFWPYVGMLGIPRDLWVDIPNVGEQRINTAYFFAEANLAGSGPAAAVDTVRLNFDVPLRYYLVLHMSGLIDFVDALGGVDVTLETPLGGLPAGTHHLDGAEALAFVRERSSADDFSRMQQGQILILASIRKTIQPATWLKFPSAFRSLSRVIETNLPAWQWPRMGFSFLRAMVFGIDSQTISRDMVTPFETSAGAQVLAPNWDRIELLLMEMFGK